MAFTLDDIRRLDPKRIGSWPAIPKLFVLGAILVAAIAASYFLDWQNQLADIDTARNKEASLRSTFIDKKKVAIDLDAYRQQLADIEKAFGTLLRQLPGKSEMEALLTDINQAGLGRGLQFDLFKPAASEAMADFYAELPINIRVTGRLPRHRRLRERCGRSVADRAAQRYCRHAHQGRRFDNGCNGQDLPLPR